MIAETQPRTHWTWRPWIIGWFGGAALGVAKGTVRQLAYEERAGHLAAHYIATAALIALLGSYIAMLDRRWPIPTRRAGLAIGGSWLGLTMLFELGLGRYIVGASSSISLLRPHRVIMRPAERHREARVCAISASCWSTITRSSVSG
jgi:hypothetical protein